MDAWTTCNALLGVGAHEEALAVAGLLRSAAAERLVQMGLRAVPLLRDLRGDLDPEVSLRAKALLERLAFPGPE